MTVLLFVADALSSASGGGVKSRAANSETRYGEANWPAVDCSAEALCVTGFCRKELFGGPKRGPIAELAAVDLIFRFLRISARWLCPRHKFVKAFRCLIRGKNLLAPGAGESAILSVR